MRPRAKCPDCEALAAKARKKSNAYYARHQAKIQARRRKRYRDKMLRKQYSNLEMGNIIRGFDMPPVKEGFRAYKANITAKELTSLNACLKRRGLARELSAMGGWRRAA